jgi:hypothetical protein
MIASAITMWVLLMAGGGLDEPKKLYEFPWSTMNGSREQMCKDAARALAQADPKHGFACFEVIKP